MKAKTAMAVDVAIVLALVLADWWATQQATAAGADATTSHSGIVGR